MLRNIWEIRVSLSAFDKQKNKRAITPFFSFGNIEACIDFVNIAGNAFNRKCRAQCCVLRTIKKNYCIPSQRHAACCAALRHTPHTVFRFGISTFSRKRFDSFKPKCIVRSCQAVRLSKAEGCCILPYVPKENNQDNLKAHYL